MKQFKEVLTFELGNYFKSKGWVITTVLIMVAIAVGLSIPSFINTDKSDSDSSDKSTFALLDTSGVIKNKDVLKDYFPNIEWKDYNNEETMKKDIENEDIKQGYVVNSATSFTHVVFNSSFEDKNDEIFSTMLSTLYRDSYFEGKNLDVKEIESIINTSISSETSVLGKDSVSNFAYTYMLIFVLYMMIIMYGQMIATSVSTEKSNRSIEILVTSTSSNSLIFGKVIAGAIAGIVQVTGILGTAIVAYRLNSDAWGGKIDALLNIPTNVLVVFGIFGLFGYLLYSFIYGGLGALVSKVEDVNKSATPVTMIFVVVFMLVMMNLTEPDAMLMKALSYIPFSSCVAMFVRVAMGTVAIYEIIISACILVATTILVGIVGAKIYRHGTLKYGNPIKLSTALKSLKKSK